MVVLITGIIAGLDDDDYIQSVIKLCKRNNLPVKVINLIDEITKQGTKPLERLLGTTDYIFELTREREYIKIGYEIQKNKDMNYLIRVPATIEWNKINRKLKDHKYIQKFITPDVIITLIDDETSIKKRFYNINELGNNFLKAIKERQHTIYEILAWMNEEVSLSEDWAKFMEVSHFVIGLKQPPETLYKFIRYSRPKVFYVSYSMTHADKKIREQINAIIARLRKYFVIIDPQSIEIGTAFTDPFEKEVIYAFTVHRDLHWFVGKVDGVIAIHPYLERPPLSTGMMDELGHARDYMKERYMIFPKATSPFTTDSYIEKGHIFEEEESFFTFLEEVKGYKPLEDYLGIEES